MHLHERVFVNYGTLLLHIPQHQEMALNKRSQEGHGEVGSIQTA